MQVQLIAAQNAEVPRSLFNFDFELERKILAEFERESQGWDSVRANGETNPAPVSIFITRVFSLSRGNLRSF